MGQTLRDLTRPRDTSLDALSKATGITRGLSPTQETLGSLLTMGVDAILGAIGVGSPDSRAAAAGELLSMALPMGVAKGTLKDLAKKVVKQPIKAYHGSPHDFDQFQMSKVGAGEGAQAQGRGLYFSQRPEVAETYRDKLAPGGSGRMYEVDINADPSELLDWDAPISQQHPAVAGVITDYLQSRPLSPHFAEKLSSGKLNGREAYLALSGELSLDDARKSWPNITKRPDALAADYLNSKGVPGIQYQDAGSRTARGEFTSKSTAGADLTRNYVVFDDKLISIVKKYGILGALAAGLVNESQMRQLKEQGYQ